MDRAAGGDFDAAATSAVMVRTGAFGWLSWNVSSLVTAWLVGTPNFGLEILEPNGNPGNMGRKDFDSAQSASTARRPVLAVTCR
jgi:hypothetical protein